MYPRIRIADHKIVEYWHVTTHIHLTFSYCLIRRVTWKTSDLTVGTQPSTSRRSAHFRVQLDLQRCLSSDRLRLEVRYGMCYLRWDVLPSIPVDTEVQRPI